MCAGVKYPVSVRIIIIGSITLTVMQWAKIVIRFVFLQGVVGAVEEEEMERQSRQFLFPFLNRLFGHGHGHGDAQPSGRYDRYVLLFFVLMNISRNDTLPQERIQDILLLEEDLDHRHRNISTRQVDSFLTESEIGSLSLIQQDCCLFLFLDGSSFYFDDFMKARTGEYQLQPGRVNGLPHYAKYPIQRVINFFKPNYLAVTVGCLGATPPLVTISGALVGGGWWGRGGILGR